MAFIWDTNPNRTTPPPILPVPVGDGEMSYEAKEVANSVNVDPIYGVGTLLWNIATPPDAGDNGLFGDFDIIYQLPSLNVKDIHVTHLNADNVTVYFNATINTANIGVATINTANIVNATIANGVMGVNPTANLQIATKEYVDALAANSIPLGGNLQLLILAAGDLLVGVSDNTAERLPVGTSNGQLLTSGGASNTGVYYSDAGSLGGTGSHRGLVIGTNMTGGSLANTEVLLQSVEEVIMDDGASIRTGWAGLTASISSNVETSGVGYLDFGVVRAQTSYEVWAIRNSSNGAQGLLLHRTPESRVDVNFRGVVTTDRRLNYSHTFNSITTINVSQSWLASSTGPLTGIDLTLSRIGTPAGNIWLTVETLVNGNASGNVLATSRYFDARRVGSITTDQLRMRFPFDTTCNVVAGNNYVFVLHADYPRGNSLNENYILVFGTNPGLTGSTTYADGECKNFSANTNTWAMANATTGIFVPSGPQDLYFRTIVQNYNTDLLMPTGYDQKCLLSFCQATNAPTAGGAQGGGDGLTNGWGIRLGNYWQIGRRITAPLHTEWQMNYNGVYGGGQPLEFQTALGTEAIELKWLVPPTPCFVTFAMYAAIGGAAPASVGRLDSTDMYGRTGDFIQSEAEGQYTTNSNFGIVVSMGPILVEFGTVNMRQPVNSSQGWIQEIEI